MSSAASLHELAKLLLAHAEAGLLDARLDVLGERFEDEEVASLLRAAFEAGEADSLRDLLADERLTAWVDRSLTGSEQRRLEAEFARLLQGGAAGTDEPERLVELAALPAREADQAALFAWAEEHDVVELLRKPVHSLWPEAALDDEHVTLAEAARGEFESTTAVGGLLTAIDLQRLARAHLQQTAAARGAFSARSALWRRSPPPGLRVLSERLRALVHKASLSELHQVRFVPAHPLELELRTGVALAKLRDPEAQRPTVSLRLLLSGYEQRPIDATCSACAGRRCLHALVVAARLLDACLDPSDRLHTRLSEFAEIPSWKRVLRELTEEPAARKMRGDRLSFVLRPVGGHVLLGCVLHKRLPDGRGSSGKLGPPQQLLKHPACSERDRSVLEAMLPHHRALSPTLVPADLTMLRALSEHPAVQYENGTRPLHVSEEVLRVELLEQAGGLLPRVTLHGTPIEAGVEPTQGYVLCSPVGESRLVFAPLTQPLRKLLNVLAHFRGVFPEESFPALAPWLSSLRGAALVQAPKALDGYERETPRTLLLRFTPNLDEGLELALSARPLPLGGVYTPGRGPHLVHGLEDGKPVHARRDLAWETQEASRVMNALELEGQVRVDTYCYRIESTQEALGLLSRAARLGPSVAIEWAERARPLTISGTAHTGDLKVNMFKRGQWFTLEGGVTHGETLIAMSTLLETARRGERFVQIEGGHYLELEQTLFERLQNAQLSVLGLSAKDLKLADSALPYWLRQLDGQTRANDRETAAWLARVKTVLGLTSPDEARGPANAPDLSGLGVQLRGYQEAGVRWLLAQAEWAHGACLADEMGLGKTLQAGAVLTLRGHLGPAMVVSPTSLLDNWRNELVRCSASLKPRVYRGDQREQHLVELGPHDVILVSYETLMRDIDAFEDLHFATQVIDEAQVIKNARTQRAQSVAKISVGFRIALSGTPIENRLGDLWSLLELLAPGLLGSWQRFRARFATPIERYEDPERAAQLKALVSPFFLRRTKREVERELPIRTDVICNVELSVPERQLYDAAVHEARRAIGHRNRHDARRTVQILAELTRLRQLACHPRLVVEQEGTSSAKLERLVGLLEDILPRGHRALIFSQFTRHLALVREALETHHYSYLYLDGATKGAVRSRLVERFQAGEGQLFLISLKAGGTGLNLTEADYVIHLDPWWNPAAEDQASDRAHRLGQQKPVTVVKLVTQDTIEEKVLALHTHKRRLAESVLLGEGSVEALDEDVLEALLRD